MAAVLKLGVATPLRVANFLKRVAKLRIQFVQIFQNKGSFVSYFTSTGSYDILNGHRNSKNKYGGCQPTPVLYKCILNKQKLLRLRYRLKHWF